MCSLFDTKKKKEKKIGFCKTNLVVGSSKLIHHLCVECVHVCMCVHVCYIEGMCLEVGPFFKVKKKKKRSKLWHTK